MNVLYLTDRLSLRGGADQHLLQVVATAAGAGHRVTVAHGRTEAGVELPPGVGSVAVRGLAAAVATTARLGRLPGLLEGADVVHVQNVMNPSALSLAVATGRAVVTVQDHRVFCPGPGKTLPDGSRCRRQMSDDACQTCLPDHAYRRRMLALTAARRDALVGARLVALSQYMADELADAGLRDAAILPPWVEVGGGPSTPGRGFALAGRLVAHKAVLDGLLAWRQAATDQPLQVAGAGPLEDQLGGSVHHGWLPVSELSQLLASCRALLFPSRWQEPFGIVVAQALAVGTPVILAATGGATELAEIGCLVVAPGDVQAMARAIQRLAADPELAMELGEAGKQAMAERLDRARIEARLLGLYAKLVG